MRSLALAALLLATPVVEGRSAAGAPIDCLPDRVVARDSGADLAANLFGATNWPGIVLGPPGESLATNGSLSVASLGWGGEVTLAFDDIEIEDRPGADLTIFENAFFVGAAPASAADDFAVFAEPARVAFSEDGVQWFDYPFDASALSQVPSGVDRALYESLAGLAGIVPTLTGNWSEPEDRALFDGPGGLSGAGGDAFDLALVGLSRARFVRITDSDLRVGFAGPGNGFDFDAIVVHHGRPSAPLELDSDGDRIADLAEVARYGTDPTRIDSDGDGIDDGRELAGCRDPLSADEGAVPPTRPRLWLDGGSCTSLHWSWLGPGQSVDVIRGDVTQLAVVGAEVDLGATACLDGASTAVRWSCDAELPTAGELWFYLVADRTADWGNDATLKRRSREFECN